MVVNVDRISELPDHLLIHILSLLDNMQDCVKTGLLSKRWKNLWTNLHTLVYKWDIENPSIKKLKRFLLFVDNTLMQCTCPKIKKFCIIGSIGSEFVNKLSPEAVKPLVDKWLNFVIEKNVEVVKLGLQELNYKIPDSLFQSSSIVSLDVDNMGKHCYYYGDFRSLVSLESSRENIGPYWYRKTFDVRWNKLKSLSLKSVYVLKDVMSEIFLGCPVLEKLVLDGVRGLKLLEITSPSVKELILLNLTYDHADVVCDLDISAPWVEKLEISGYCNSVRLNLVRVPSLKSASLTFNYSHFRYLGSYLDEETDVDPQGYFKAVWVNMIDCLLQPLCTIDELVVGVELLQALSMSKLLDGGSPTFNFKHVTLQSPTCVHEVPGMVSMLESSPFMETLVIKLMPWQCHSSTYNKRHSYYTNYVNNYFPSFSVIDYLSKSEHKGKFIHLKNVKIDGTELHSCGDEDQGSKNKCLGLKVVAHIVRNAPHLEKLSIFSSTSNGSDFATRYFQLMSSKDEVGEKATTWDLKKRKSSFEFTFC